MGKNKLKTIFFSDENTPIQTITAIFSEIRIFNISVLDNTNYKFIKGGIMISILVAIITAISSILIAKITNSKMEERRIMIIGKLSLIMEKDIVNNKYEVSKLFEELTGMQYNYTEIINILKKDNAIWIIYTLQKIPGYVKYENDKLVYNNMFQNQKIRKSYHFIEQLYLYFFIFMLMISIVLFFFTIGDIYSQGATIVLFVFFFFLIDKILKSIKITKQVRNKIDTSNLFEEKEE